MKYLILFLLFGLMGVYSNADEIPQHDWRIKLTPEKYDVIQNSKFKGESLLNKELKPNECRLIIINNLKDADLVDRLMSFNKIEYKFYKNPDSKIRNLYLYVQPKKYQEAMSIIEAAVKVKLMKRYFFGPVY